MRIRGPLILACSESALAPTIFKTIRCTTTGGSAQLLDNRERVATSYVSRLLRLPSLAPDIITAILNGKKPPQLTAKNLMCLAPKIPVGWSVRRDMRGFR